MINSARRSTETEIALALLSRWEQDFMYEIHTTRGWKLFIGLENKKRLSYGLWEKMQTKKGGEGSVEQDENNCKKQKKKCLQEEGKTVFCNCILTEA